jgi:uncharacterized protein YbcV (DUF1398 family)
VYLTQISSSAAKVSHAQNFSHHTTQLGKALPLHAGGGVAFAGFGVGVGDAGVMQWRVHKWCATART